MSPQLSRRLVAHLRVKRRFGSHEEAAEWYRAQGLPLPSNCMVAGNTPLRYDRTAGHSALRSRLESNRVRVWDAQYAARAIRHPTFLACESIWQDLYVPPAIDVCDYEMVLMAVPLLRNAKVIQKAELQELLVRAHWR
jgi:hypothetical protein